MSIKLEVLTRSIRGAFPVEFADAYAAVTTLGDATFLIFALSMVYVVGRRRETAAVVGYGFAGYGAILALKTTLEMARPPEAVRLIEASGYGFPSGHAAAAMVVYGGLAVEYDWLADRRKTAAAGVLVVAVAFSRVALGVHYVGGILAGLVVGGVVLLGARRLSGGDPRLIFAVGTPLALAAVAVTGVGAEALGVLGACLGGVAAGGLPDEASDPRSRLEVGALVVAALVFVVAIQVAESAFVQFPLGTALDDAILVAGVLAMPIVVARGYDEVAGRGSESD